MRTWIVIVCIWIMFCSWTETFGQGIEIYPVKHDFPDFTKENIDSSCYYCFEPKQTDLFDSALIRQSDIEYFDWENQKVKLRDSGLQKMKGLKIPLQGLAVAITIEKVPIYGFWLWNYNSSFGCDWVCTYPELGFYIQYGLPNGHTKGKDPRFDKRIEDYLIKTKLKK